MDLISIAEAAKLTGRHEKTIRRWIKKQIAIDPQARERIIHEKIASGFTYRVDKDYLLARSPTLDNPPEQVTEQGSVHPPEQPTRQPEHLTNPLAAAKDETIAILKEQVRQQQEELKSKNEQLDTMLERLREQNILLKGYQEKYLLEAPKEQRAVDSPLDTQDVQRTGQDTVHSDEQARQTNLSRTDTNHKRKEPLTKQKGDKSPSKQSEKKAHKPEQPKKKGFFSFLKGK